jgi:hypothetical protein
MGKQTEDEQMPTLHWGAETRADRETNMAALRQLHQRLDATIGRVLDEFLAATELRGQYTVGTSVQPPAWWLGNGHTATAARPLHIHVQFDESDRTTPPTLAVDIQGVAARVPQDVHALGHVLHRETGHRVRVQGSQGTAEVWPQANSQPGHGPHHARAT